MKCSALNVDSNGVRVDPLCPRSPPYERIKFRYPRENVRILLLSTNLAREWLQIDTDFLRIITSTADELSGVPTSMTLNDFDFIFSLLKCLKMCNFNVYFLKNFLGHSAQTPILGRGYGAPPQPHPHRRFAPPAPRSGPSVPPSSGRDMG